MYTVYLNNFSRYEFTTHEMCQIQVHNHESAILNRQTLTSTLNIYELLSSEFHMNSYNLSSGIIHKRKIANIDLVTQHKLL